ncbi:hypothetical protein Mal4_35170 [Maioricimonas rarisocia]|uniref:Uncharacterized protein n=1 Tax=Maioricimonas rarisocia TaxID=2528026 RepID=A0A517Z9R9_9PLAN|nr:DUF4332 domain-containing protein [Maioricimonas rarisocia]QDU39181.1 hypothetical protein Mal4_35170 [Maioricimonas rarisocia]
MSLLERVLYAWKCKGTHHKLAMDALRHLDVDEAPAWRNLFLANIEPYLDGAKAPDTKFRDFRNHVLHVADGEWGGAIAAAELWFQRTVEAFAAEDWQRGVYAAGVLSHYMTDPFMPLHTAQSEAEGTIHRACEWSVSKSYDALRQLYEASDDAAELPSADGSGWLGDLIRDGAWRAHCCYEEVVENYDLDRGVSDPPAGLTPQLQKHFARQLGHAAVAFGTALNRALCEAGTSPPRTLATLHGLLATVTIPIFWITRRMADTGERRVVKAIYDELQLTGRVDQSLPEECRQIRDALAGDEPVELESMASPQGRPAPPARTAPPTRKAPPVDSAHASDSGPIIHSAPPAPSTPSPDSADTSRRRPPMREHVAAQEEPGTPADVQAASEPAPQPDAAAGSHAADSESLRFWLSPDDPLVDAPSIGSKTARRLRRVRMRTVADLLECDPYEVSDVLDVHYMDGETIRSWQEQASLMCRVPGLRGHDAQILVACGITEPEDLAVADVDELTEQCRQFVESEDGQRLLRDPMPPLPEEVAAWIDQADHARPLAAA